MPLSSAEERRSLKANVLGSIPRGAANVARGQGGYGPVCKTGETGSIPVRASKTLQWLETPAQTSAAEVANALAPTEPKRLSLADLREAGRRRREAAIQATNELRRAPAE